MQRILLEEAAAGGSLTMYDRVKRRAAATKPEEQKKKTDALEIIREKKQVNVNLSFFLIKQSLEKAATHPFVFI